MIDSMRSYVENHFLPMIIITIYYDMFHHHHHYHLSFIITTIRRILSVDSNQQLLLGLSDSGYPLTSLDIHAQFDILWPHQISCRSLDNTNDDDDDDDVQSLEVYISELLGRIWKLQLHWDQSTGRLNFM